MGNSTKLTSIFSLVLAAVLMTGCGGNTTGKTTAATVGEDQKQVVVTSNVPYREGNSQSWLLDVAQPVNFGEEIRPVIVIVHGGGWRGGSKHHMVYRDLLIDYALQGYVTVSVGYRFVQEADFPACIEDVKCAVRWIKAHAEELRIDPDRIGSYGHSAGAHLSLMLGVSSGNKELEGDGPWQEFSSSLACTAAGATPTSTNRGAWAEHPEWWPIGYISADNPPILLLQGIDDMTVRVETVDDYVEKMKEVGADIEYVRIPGNHGVAYEFGLDVTKPAMDAFFAKHLKK